MTHTPIDAPAIAPHGPLPAPAAQLRACVVVPAQDEQERIAACLQALAAQEGVAPDEYELLLVLDACTDATEARALATAAELPLLRVHIISGPGEGAGAARRAGMDLACRRFVAVGRDDGLIVCSDADSRVAADWLRTQLDAVAAGARAIGGRVSLDPVEARELPPLVLARREQLAAERYTRVRAESATAGDSPPEHWQFSGASMAVTAEAYRAIGGIDPAFPALEDEAFERRLREHRIPIERPLAVRVTTSARRHGRARRGLALDLEVNDWLARRSYRADSFPRERLVELRRGAHAGGALARVAAGDGSGAIDHGDGGSTSVSVVLPAREVAATIGPIIDAIMPLREAGVIDELVVIDAASADGTAAIAQAHGARVVQESTVLADHGPARGKGDALWRSLAVTSGDVVVFLDSDTENFDDRFLRGLLGPLLEDPAVAFVKGAFRRPFKLGETTVPDGGGRVTELVARPLLNLHVPELAGFVQPLAGEFAARRSLLEQLPFPVGYGVEIATLIDALRIAGLDALAQVDLGERQNRHQSLRALSAMAYAVMVAAERRVHGEQALARSAPGPIVFPHGDELEVRQVAVDERPPLISLRRAA